MNGDDDDTFQQRKSTVDELGHTAVLNLRCLQAVCPMAPVLTVLATNKNSRVPRGRTEVQRHPQTDKQKHQKTRSLTRSKTCLLPDPSEHQNLQLQGQDRSHKGFTVSLVQSTWPLLKNGCSSTITAVPLFCQLVQIRLQKRGLTRSLCIPRRGREFERSDCGESNTLSAANTDIGTTIEKIIWTTTTLQTRCGHPSSQRTRTQEPKKKRRRATEPQVMPSSFLTSPRVLGCRSPLSMAAERMTNCN